MQKFVSEILFSPISNIGLLLTLGVGTAIRSGIMSYEQQEQTKEQEKQTQLDNEISVIAPANLAKLSHQQQDRVAELFKQNDLFIASCTYGAIGTPDRDQVMSRLKNIAKEVKQMTKA